MDATKVMEKEEVDAIMAKYPGAELDLVVLDAEGKSTEDISKAVKGRLMIIVGDKLEEEMHFTFAPQAT